MKVFVASLGNNQTWKKLQPGTKANYIFIKDLEDQVIGLVGETTGHIKMIMPSQEFALI